MTERYVTGRRTTTAPGKAAEYARVHARLPEAAAAELRSAGIVRWEIWQDGDRLFHRVESTRRYVEVIADLRSHPPADPAWGALIATLLSSEPGDDVLLPLVWVMNEGTQWSGLSEVPGKLSP